MFGGDSEELEHRVAIEFIVGLAKKVKGHALHGNVKLIEGVPTTEPYIKPGEFTALCHTLYIQCFLVILVSLLCLYFWELAFLGAFNNFAKSDY
jgi:hypothetical protein